MGTFHCPILRSTPVKWIPQSYLIGLGIDIGGALFVVGGRVTVAAQFRPTCAGRRTHAGPHGDPKGEIAEKDADERADRQAEAYAGADQLISFHWGRSWKTTAHARDFPWASSQTRRRAGTAVGHEVGRE